MTAPSGSTRYRPSGPASASGAVLLGGELCDAGAAHDERRPPDAGPGHLAEPQHELDHLAVDRDPLRLAVVRDEVAIDARTELDAGGPVASDAERPLERRRPVGGVVEPVLVGPAGGIEPDAADAGEVGGLGVALLDARRGEGREVVGGDGGGDLVALDGEHSEVECGEGERVGADAATEVGHDIHARLGEAARVQRRDPQPRGLFETVGGEEHARREVAELRHRLGAQAGLTEDGGDEAARVPGGAEAGDDAHDVDRRVDRPHLVEQPQALGREQFAQLGDIHPATLAPRQFAHLRIGTRIERLLTRPYS